MSAARPRVALIAAHAPPQVRPQAILLGKLLRHLPGQGLDVSLLTGADAGGLRGIHLYRYQPRGRLVSSIMARLSPASFALQTRLVHHGAFAAMRRMATERQVQAVMSFANPYTMNILGAQLCRSNAVPFIAHYSDPFVDSPYQPQPERIREGRLAAERQVLGQADVVVFVNERLRDWVLQRHPDGVVRRTEIIPHSFERALYPENLPGRKRPYLLIRHIGALYGPRNADNFLKALEVLRNNDPDIFNHLRAEFIGADLYGADNDFSSQVHGHGLEGSVAIRPVVPYAESLGAMVDADLLLNIDAGEGAPIFLTSKLIDYLGAGRPVLCLTQPGSPSDLVCRRAGASVADIRNVGEIAQALRNFATGEMTQPPDPDYVDSFAVERIARTWADLFRDVAGSRCL
jgi:hypothetical protein